MPLTFLLKNVSFYKKYIHSYDNMTQLANLTIERISTFYKLLILLYLGSS